MFVITADQIDSRDNPDIVGATLEVLNHGHGESLALPVDRNAGDELQAMTADPVTALALVLELTRGRRWSVGLGCGTVRLPLPAATREASGPAFFAARDAVIRAKRMPTRFAAQIPNTGATVTASDAEALVNLLLLLRERRSAAGWELYDLMVTGMAQNEAARRLGISAPAANSRARAGGIKAELASVGALTRLLGTLDRVATETDATP